MEDIQARLDNSLFVFAPRLVSSEYKLMTLDGDLLKHIEAGNSLWVKAAAGSNAVVCTETKTFELQLVETSNSLLLAQVNVAGSGDDEDMSDDEHAAAAGAAGAGREVEVVGLCSSSFEAKPTPPRLELLHALLQRSMLTVEDANEDAAAGEDDADGGSFSPRKRQRDADSASGTTAQAAARAPISPPKTPSSKSASAAAASAAKGAEDDTAATPAGKAVAAEARTLNRATHFTLRDLEACVQASRAEIVVELSALGVVRRKGYERLISPELRAAVVGAVLDAIAENAMPLLAVRPSSVAAFVGDRFPAYAVRFALARLGREHPTQPGKWCVSVRRSARFLGRQLLDLVRQQAAGKAGLIEEGEFLAAWAAAVENLTALGGPKSLEDAAKTPTGASDSAAGAPLDADGEFTLDGFEAKLTVLEGLFVRHDKAGESMLECYPEDELPLDAKQRFAALFNKQTEWGKDEIQPFVDPITGPGRTLVDLLLRFTRVVNKTDGSIVHARR